MESADERRAAELWMKHMTGVREGLLSSCGSIPARAHDAILEAIRGEREAIAAMIPGLIGEPENDDDWPDCDAIAQAIRSRTSGKDGV